MATREVKKSPAPTRTLELPESSSSSEGAGAPSGVPISSSKAGLSLSGESASGLSAGRLSSFDGPGASTGELTSGGGEEVVGAMDGDDDGDVDGDGDETGEEDGVGEDSVEEIGAGDEMGMEVGDEVVVESSGEAAGS